MEVKESVEYLQSPEISQGQHLLLSEGRLIV